jgi:hypothetical protein
MGRIRVAEKADCPMKDAITWFGATLLLWVACPINEHVNAWGFAFGLHDWSWAWIWLTLGSLALGLSAYVRGWERR